MAENICELNLEKFPGDANLLVLSARANIALRRFEKARSRIDEAIRLFPDFPGAHETYGDLLILQGRPGDACESYQQAMRLDPTRAIIHDKIARARDLEKQASASPRPEKPRLMSNADEMAIAQEYEKNEDPQSAEMIYRDILKKNPNHVEAARLLAAIASANQVYDEARILLQRVVHNAPGYARAWIDLANVQRELHLFEESAYSAEKVLELEPGMAESHIVYASAIGALGEHEKAIAAYEKALEISPKKSMAMSAMGHHLKTIGEQKAAISSYRRAIEVNPTNAEAYAGLANLKTFRFEESEIESMLELLDRTDQQDESYIQIHNALGLHFENVGDFDRAFGHFDECSKRRRKNEKYDPVDTEDTAGRIIETFTREFMEERAAPPADVTPIFVVGLPRSGSTLVEQILASHSQVDGTHELTDLQRSIMSARKPAQRRERFPEALTRFSTEDWRQIGQAYIDSTRLHRGTAPYFVDKNPNNFFYTGVLRISLPNAKVIDARRHPLDSCFGSYKQLFASGQPFSYDLTEVGEYYLQYRRVIEHWREVLPGFVLEVNYEDVVSDLETQVRRILDFCGLPFEDACLRFHETDRAVKTASSEQVRRPIYASSVDLWRNYEHHLDELVQSLKPVLEQLPPDRQPKALAGQDGR